jgi:hypothetical protein
MHLSRQPELLQTTKTIPDIYWKVQLAAVTAITY